MPIPASLRDVTDALELLSGDVSAFLNRETGEVTWFTGDDLRLAEDEDLRADLPVWQQKLLALADQVLESPDWLGLPDQFEIHEYNIMKGFCRSVEDGELSDELLDQIRGSGAFRRFKDAIHRHGVAEQWYDYRRRTFEEIAADWLELHEIPFVRPEPRESSHPQRDSRDRR